MGTQKYILVRIKILLTRNKRESIMAGLGRRSHYRKHLTDTVLNEYPIPNITKGEYVVKVLSSRGGNLFDLIVQTNNSTNDEDNKQRSKEILAILPTKYRKLVWIKRGDYVIVESGTTQQKEELDVIVKDVVDLSNNDSGGIRYLIKYILYKKQITHLKENNLWPAIFIDDNTNLFKTESIIEKAKLIATQKKKEKKIIEENNEYDDDEYYTSEEEDGDDDDLFFINTNRLATMKIDDSSSDDDDDSY